MTLIPERKQTKPMNYYKFLPLLGLTAVFMTGCSGHQSAVQQLNDPKKRDEIMNTICADNQLVGDMAEHLGKSETALAGLTANRDLMRVLFTEKHLALEMKSDTALSSILPANLVHMAANDSVLCNQLARRIVASDALAYEVKRLMHEGKEGKEKKKKGSKKKSKKSK
jgi:hypothetical protein